MRPVLREYQTLAVEYGLKSLEKGKPEIIVSPTGTGKSLIISELCHNLTEPVLILQPSKEILEQNYSKLISYSIDDIGIYSAAMKRREIAQYTYATIGSIYKSPELFKDFKYLIIDEAQNVGHEASGMYRTFLKKLPKMRVIGLSATPYRQQQRYYIEPGTNLAFYTAMLRVQTVIHPPFFKGFAFKINNQTMFDKGFLAPIDYVTDHDIDISRLKTNTTGADFDEYALDQLMNHPDNVLRLAQLIIDEDEYTINNLIFCSSVKQARSTAEVLAKEGYDSEVITGNDPNRDEKIARFRAGKIKRLLNVKVMGIGFDYPGLYTVTLGMPTMSLGFLYQLIGRCIRPDPNNPHKRATILDLCGNIKRLGTIESIRITQNPITKKDQVETNAGVISDKPLYKFKVTNQRVVNWLSAQNSQHGRT